MKSLFFFFSFTLSFISYSQYFEGFEDGVPGGMKQIYIEGNIDFTDCGGSSGNIICPYTGDSSASFYSLNNFGDSTSLETPVITLSNGVYRLEFDHTQKKRRDINNSLKIEISNDGGASFSLLTSYLEDTPIWTHEIIFFYVGNSNEDIVLRFTATNGEAGVGYGYALMLDNILVEEALSEDLGMESVDVPIIVQPNSNNLIKGAIRNYGSDIIHSFNINWQDNGGDIYTDVISNLFIQSNQLYNFQHSEIWNVNTGFHILDVWVSNINGNGDDQNLSNNHMLLGVNAPNHAVGRVPLYEEFTSSSCGPCQYFNENIFNESFLETYEGYYTLIKYQMNWPTVDLYYTEEGGTRRDYYGVNGVPALYLDAEFGTFNTQAQLFDHLLTKFVDPAYIVMTADHTISGEDIEINVDILSYLKGNYSLHVVVYENETIGNVGTNGETSFINVMMKMIPDAEGTPISLEIEEPQTLSFNVNLSDTNIEEFDDIGVVVFIQDDSNKMLMQSVESIDTSIGISDSILKKIKLFPNPSNGSLTIESSFDYFDSIKIYTFQGNLVKEFFNTKEIDMIGLSSGIYAVKLCVDDTCITKKLIKK